MRLLVLLLLLPLVSGCMIKIERGPEAAPKTEAKK